MKYLLDTDHITFLERPSSTEYARLVARMSQHVPADFVFATTSFQEQVLGANAYIGRAHSTTDLIRGYALLDQVRHTFQTFPVLPFDAAVGTVYDGLLAQRIRIGSMDLRIAAIALTHKVILLSRNVADFGKVPGLVTEDWTK